MKHAGIRSEENLRNVYGSFLLRIGASFNKKKKKDRKKFHTQNYNFECQDKTINSTTFKNSKL